jgi:hypothetical protein
MRRLLDSATVSAGGRVQELVIHACTSEPWPRGELRPVIPCVAVLRAIAVSGVDRVIPHFPTLDEALAQPQAVMIRLRRRRPSPGMRVLAELMSDTPDTGTAAPATR